MPKIEYLKSHLSLKYHLDNTEEAKASRAITLAALQDYEDANKLDENGLKGCPCCQSDSVRVVQSGQNYKYKLLFYIECRKCGMRTKTSVNKSGIYKAWNTRPQTKANAAIARIVEGEKA